jgi:hypothetical protein
VHMTKNDFSKRLLLNLSALGLGEQDLGRLNARSGTGKFWLPIALTTLNVAAAV